MFTGIVRQRARVIGAPAPSLGGGRRLRLALGHALSERLALGDSLAVDGVCLTLVDRSGEVGEFELAPETLARSRLGERVDGDLVHVEPALRVGDALGGHWVQGHDDGLLEVLEVEEYSEHRWIRFHLPPELARYVAEKGSIALDGVSLTVARLEESAFAVTVLPFTAAHTRLGELTAGDRVHCEVDILAKYVERGREAELR